MSRPRPARLLLAPLTALERARGWRRRGLIVLYLTVAVIAGGLGVREARVRGLPRAPEPFDLARFGRVELADADNAFVAYREVLARFGDLRTDGYTAEPKAWEVSDWSAAHPEVRRWAEDHRTALAAWIPANDRPDALLVQPRDLTISTALEPAHASRRYVRLALLEGSRLEQEGDLAGAWRSYRAALRASRLVGRHGPGVLRLMGNRYLRDARPRVESWIARPGMTPDLLRRAARDVEACRDLSAPASEMVRVEYLAARNSLNWPEFSSGTSGAGPYSRAEWSNHYAGVRWARRFLRHESERSARILRLVTAGYLAQCDRPRSERAPLAFPDVMIYRHDSRTPPAVRAISPEELRRWYLDSLVREICPYNAFVQSDLDAEAATFEGFLLDLAERRFALERGRPARTYGELLGGYLEALPAGIEPGFLLDPAWDDDALGP